MRQTLTKVRTGFSAFYNRFGNVPFVGLLLIVALYLRGNGGALFPDWDQSYGQLIDSYMIMMLIFLLYSVRAMKKEEQTPLWFASRAFFFCFIITWGILECFVLTGLITVPEFPMSLFWQTILLQVCVIATAEEVIFRGVFLHGFNFYFKSIPIAIIGSSLAFAIWHLWAYQIILYQKNWSSFDWLSLVVAFFIGVILAVVALNKKWGVGATIAIHSCWNLMILGVLAL